MALTPTHILNRYGKERRFDESDESLLSRLLTVRFNESNVRISNRYFRSLKIVFSAHDYR